MSHWRRQLIRAALLVGLAGSVVLQSLPGWDQFRLEPDSPGYILHADLRPPIYPWFIRLVGGKYCAQQFQQLPIGAPIVDGPAPGLLRAVRAQQLVLLFCFLTMAWELMAWTAPLVAALACFGLVQCGFLAGDANTLLTEPLTQAWLFLLAAATLRWIRSEAAWLLAGIAALCALLFLTRPAGLFAFALLAAVLGIALLRNWRRNGLAVAAALAVAVVPVGLDVLYRHQRDGVWALTPMYGYTRIGFALQVAEPEDVALMPDEASRAFFLEALQRKVQADRHVPNGRPASRVPSWEYFDPNLYSVALPVEEELHRHDSANRSTASVSAFLGGVAGPLLHRHWAEYAAIVRQSFVHYAIGASTRLCSPRFPFSTILVLAGALALLGRNRAALAGCLLLMAHILHLLVICAHGTPITRYVWNSEFLFLAGCFLIGLGAWQRLALMPRWSGRIPSLRYLQAAARVHFR